MRPALAVLLLVAVLLPAPALAAEANASPEVGDPPYRATGQWILYLTMAFIAAGLAGVWWVVKRYEP